MIETITGPMRRKPARQADRHTAAAWLALGLTIIIFILIV